MPERPPVDFLSVECVQCGAPQGTPCTALGGTQRGKPLSRSKTHAFRQVHAISEEQARKVLAVLEQEATLYPEHAKLKLVEAESLRLGDFLDWLDQKGYVICEVSPSDRCEPIMMRHDALLADHFGIDLKKLEREKRAMLAAQVTANSSRQP